MCERTNLSIWLVIFAFFAALGTGSIAAANIIYVDDDAAGANDGKSWENAFVHLQDGLTAALFSSIRPIEIRVAQGTYRPDQGIEVTPGDREATFHLINGVTLKGGYAGLGEHDPDARDVEAYETLLSGDLAGNDVDVNNLWDLFDEPTRAENSYHVVTCLNTDETLVLEGFTVTGGNANGDWFTHAVESAGMLNISSSPIITNCIFSGNSSRAEAAGMQNSYNSNPKIINCTFSRNLAKTDGAGMYNSDSAPTLINCTFSDNYSQHNGGGLCNFYGSCAILVNCIFSDNSADVGGAMFNYPRSNPTLTNCFFSGNSADRYGGGIANELGSPTVTNCTFAGNSAGIGGGMLNWLANATLSECTFASNSALNGNAIACDYVWRTPQKHVKLTNCILCDGGSEIWNNSGSMIDIAYSNIEGGQEALYDPCDSVVWGKGNIDVDPCFAEPGYWDPNGTPEDPNDDFWVDGDYHLKSQAGRWDSSSASWVKDDVTSLCIDAGDPNSPIGFEPFPNGGIINIGAYGGTAEASKSYFGEPVCETIVAGDINGDCKVDFKDFAIMARHWLESVE